MCRVYRMQTRLFRITTAELFQRRYVSQEKLRRAGHVMLSPLDRLPRQMISSWVRSKRPKGCPNLNYGRSRKEFFKKS